MLSLVGLTALEAGLADFLEQLLEGVGRRCTVVVQQPDPRLRSSRAGGPPGAIGRAGVDGDQVVRHPALAGQAVEHVGEPAEPVVTHQDRGDVMSALDESARWTMVRASHDRSHRAAALAVGRANHPTARGRRPQTSDPHTGGRGSRRGRRPICSQWAVHACNLCSDGLLLQLSPLTLGQPAPDAEPLVVGQCVL